MVIISAVSSSLCAPIPSFLLHITQICSKSNRHFRLSPSKTYKYVAYMDVQKHTDLFMIQ